jgi:tRNA A22 N-methylase
MKKVLNIKDFTLEEVIGMVEQGELFVSFDEDVVDVDDERLYCERGKYYEVVRVPDDNEAQCLTEIEKVDIQFLLYGDDASYVLVKE